MKFVAILGFLVLLVFSEANLKTRRALPTVLEKVEVGDEFTDGNPEEKNRESLHMFEGDIALTEPLGRNAVLESKTWPNKEIPYMISASDFTVDQRNKIQNAINTFSKETCVKWVPAKDDQYPRVQFVKLGGCFSYVGASAYFSYYKQPQNLSLANGCFYNNGGTILHEMMHASGFYHEQSRKDASDYIHVCTDNIYPGAESNFKAAANTQLLNSPYNYASVMHYSSHAFSKNSLPTIIPLKDGGHQMGQRNGFHDIDVYKINKLYGCPATLPGGGGSVVTTTTTEAPTTGGTLIDCNFENGICDGMIQDSGFQWTRHAGSTRSSRTGPSADHTKQSRAGYYMYTEATGRRSGDKATMWITYGDAARSVCLQFWYHMYGSSEPTTAMGKLQIVLKGSINSGRRRRKRAALSLADRCAGKTKRSFPSIWDKVGVGEEKEENIEKRATESALTVAKGNRGDQWHGVHVSIRGTNMVGIRGIRGTSYKSDIAIDDIKVLDGSC